ncbi:HAD family hydrolase [Amphritea sp. 2_MG-2023]|uniref:histidinol-phosphatase n=1 Tax=Amphritea TaxID=515417 RepID=UPI001C076C1D|nr:MULTISPECIES: HAD family hydrolase [Amphritea]MBU2967163.1 HAD-IB family hydrolase [Amphritea atlantica]MDO6419284.1 HAD family hydrolase [Amphritea sp. 2_MG-2023]MDX2423438.1 HAD family hydrolase [Amphritea sp.]
MSLAIFDLDNTLLNGDSDHAWGEFLCTKGIVDTQAYRQANDYFYQQYKSGTLDIVEFLEFALKPLSEHEPEVLEQLHQEFMQTTIAPMMLDKAATLLQKHRDQGDYLLIITATNRFVTGPIAALLGVDDTLATEPEMIDGRYTGKVSGTPCFQAGKVERLNAWLEQTGHSMEDSYFYSDSINDKPLLERVTHPVAVDPDELLKQAAEENGWPIISLR